MWVLGKELRFTGRAANALSASTHSAAIYEPVTCSAVQYCMVAGTPLSSRFWISSLVSYFSCTNQSLACSSEDVGTCSSPVLAIRLQMISQQKHRICRTKMSVLLTISNTRETKGTVGTGKRAFKGGTLGINLPPSPQVWWHTSESQHWVTISGVINYKFLFWMFPQWKQSRISTTNTKRNASWVGS